MILINNILMFIYFFASLIDNSNYRSNSNVICEDNNQTVKIMLQQTRLNSHAIALSVSSLVEKFNLLPEDKQNMCLYFFLDYANMNKLPDPKAFIDYQLNNLDYQVYEKINMNYNTNFFSEIIDFFNTLSNAFKNHIEREVVSILKERLKQNKKLH